MAWESPSAATIAVDAASTFSDWHCDRLRLVGGTRGRDGAGGGGLSNDGVMKGEVGGDWEERLDKAEVGQRHQPTGEGQNNQNQRPDQSKNFGLILLLVLAKSISISISIIKQH